MTYTVTKGRTALGIEHCFHGPGLPQHANGIHVLQLLNDWAERCLLKDAEEGGDRSQHEADTVLRLLACAFEAGREDAKREIRRALGANP